MDNWYTTSDPISGSK